MHNFSISRIKSCDKNKNLRWVKFFCVNFHIYTHLKGKKTFFYDHRGKFENFHGGQLNSDFCGLMALPFCSPALFFNDSVKSDILNSHLIPIKMGSHFDGFKGKDFISRKRRLIEFFNRVSERDGLKYFYGDFLEFSEGFFPKRIGWRTLRKLSAF